MIRFCGGFIYKTRDQIEFPDKKIGGDRLPLLYIMVQTGKLGINIFQIA